MTIEDIKEAIRKADLLNRPYIVYGNSKTIDAIKSALPRIEEEVVLEVVDFLEDGKTYAIKRQDLEKWYSGIDVKGVWNE